MGAAPPGRGRGAGPRRRCAQPAAATSTLVPLSIHSALPFFHSQESWRDRAELVRIAAKRAEEALGGPLRSRYHVGDAPMDVQAAEAAGAQAIGVTTGIYTREELEGAGRGAVVLDGVADLRQVLGALSLHD